MFASLVLMYYANRAAVKAVGVTEKIGQKQVRAYMSVNSCAVKVDIDTEADMVWWHLGLTLSNSGQSPGRDVVIQLDEWRSDPYQEVRVADFSAGVSRTEWVIDGMEVDDLHFVDENDTVTGIRKKANVRFSDVFDQEETISGEFTG